MCGRFAQAQTREEYLAYLADEGDRTSRTTRSLLASTTSRPVQKSCC